MIWLIDGYNVIRQDPELAGIDRRSLEAGRRGLLRLIARVAQGSRDEFLVVFDGARVAATASAGGQVRTLFSRPPERADDVLARLAQQHGAGAIVVTSDGAIQAGARRARAVVLSAEAFLERVAMTERTTGSPHGDPPYAEWSGWQAESDEADDDPGRPSVKRGNPRRLSRAERDRRRALRRLRPS